MMSFQVNNSPTKLPAKAGAELRSDTLGKTASLETGNPDVQIPMILPEDGRTEKPEEKNTVGTGNPDIRVPKKLKREEGLHVGDAEDEEEAEERGSEKAERLETGEDEEKDERGERRLFDSQRDTTRGQDSPTKPDLRHVPEGTWLQQVFLPTPMPRNCHQSPGTLRKKNTKEINSTKDFRY
ncbi:hypothetical protein NDU88_001070 [Pleurodeles waltl]|uniref:Uncharacterized protein n=1 Tax=Pleurodeles waltl TaxID=8319 RepID=A0AAV7WJD1_PLEWA|nr:hypothetical protein NDU88_001070 [Pleurodeles waltl]